MAEYMKPAPDASARPATQDRQEGRTTRPSLNRRAAESGTIPDPENHNPFSRHKPGTGETGRKREGHSLLTLWGKIK